MENAEDRTHERAYVLDEDSGVVTLEEMSFTKGICKRFVYFYGFVVCFLCFRAASTVIRLHDQNM